MGGRTEADSRQAPTPARGAACATPRAPGNNLGATPGSPAPEPPAADNDGGAGQAEPTLQSGSKLKRGGISQTDHNNGAGPLCRALPALPSLAHSACHLLIPNSPLIDLSWDQAQGALSGPWMQVGGSALLARMVVTCRALCARSAWDWAPLRVKETVQQLEVKPLWVAISKRFVG